MGLVFLVPSQTIGWEERLRNDLFCVEWDVTPYSTFLSNIQLDPLATAIVTSKFCGTQGDVISIHIYASWISPLSCG